MKRTQLLTIGIVLLTGTWILLAAEKPAQDQSTRPVDLVICLDTSGSMSGLIESAKQKLWAVVNELATAKPHPKLRVALYQYGNDGLNKENGWVQRICELTGDLDAVYGKLFALRTNGGTEYVARVVRAATMELDWSKDKDALRIIFVAGNEPATQDKKYPLKDVCAAAAGKGIIINTIHCGDEATGRRTGWADVARWADGRYAAIDQNHGTVVINTPHDQKLAALSRELNTTYVAFGVRGRAGAALQTEQDNNAATLNPAAEAQRAAAKSSHMYSNAVWDLVDASKEKDFDLAKVEAKDLPEQMRKMSLPEREAYIAKQTKRRAEVQAQIKRLSTLRDEHVKKEMEKKGLSEKSSFDAALRAAIREQAKRNNFTFE